MIATLVLMRARKGIARIVVPLGVGAMLACCVAAPRDTTSAAEHRQLAEQLEVEAADNEAKILGEQAFLSGYFRGKAKELRQGAKEHLAAATKLERRAALVCASLTAEARGVCPLPGRATAIEQSDDGVRIRFPATVALEEELARARCRMALAQAYGAGDCPFDVPGLEVEIDADEHALEVEARDEAGRADLRARAARVLPALAGASR